MAPHSLLLIIVKLVACYSEIKVLTLHCGAITLQWLHNEHNGISNASRLLAQPLVQAHQKHQSSAPLAFVRGIHRWPVDSPYKGPVTRKSFHLMTSSWWTLIITKSMSITAGLIDVERITVHWKGNVIVKKFSSLTAPEVVIFIASAQLILEILSKWKHFGISTIGGVINEFTPSHKGPLQWS